LYVQFNFWVAKITTEIYLCPGCENAKLISVAPTLGIRETRHIHGKGVIYDFLRDGFDWQDKLKLI